MKSKSIVIPIILALISSGIITGIVFYFYPVKQLNPEAIVILNNRDFKKYSSSGDGSAENPYIIKGYNITNPHTSGWTATGAIIKETTKHFILTDCTFTDYYRGILVRSAKSGTATVMNNTILEGAYSPNAPSSGIELHDSHEVEVYNNSIGYFYEKGINLLWSNNCTIKNNYVANCGSGISVSSSNTTTLFENLLNSNGIGIICSSYIYTSRGHNINNNTCINGNSGIRVGEGFDFQVAHNIVSMNLEGIVSYGYNYTIFGNYISYNLNGGIALSSSSRFNLVYHNSIIENFSPDLLEESQGFDDGQSNNWYSSILLSGNYWSNLGNATTYLIDGEAGSIDLYPLSSPI